MHHCFMSELIRLFSCNEFRRSFTVLQRAAVFWITRGSSIFVAQLVVKPTSDWQDLGNLMTNEAERTAIRRFSYREKELKAEETTRAAREATDAETEARDAKTSKLRAARLAAQDAGTLGVKPHIGRRR